MLWNLKIIKLLRTYFKMHYKMTLKANQFCFHLIYSRFSQEKYEDLTWLLQYNQEHPSDLDALKLLHKYHCAQKNEECLKLEQVILLREQ